HVKIVVGFALPAALCYAFVGRTSRFVLAVCGVVLGAAVGMAIKTSPTLVAQQRSFFGVLGVHGIPLRLDDGKTVVALQLIHGTTLHGEQFRDFSDDARDREERFAPRSYYHRTGPLGQVLAAYNASAD